MNRIAESRRASPLRQGWFIPFVPSRRYSYAFRCWNSSPSLRSYLQATRVHVSKLAGSKGLGSDIIKHLTAIFWNLRIAAFSDLDRNSGMRLGALLSDSR